jgi:TIR domain
MELSVWFDASLEVGSGEGFDAEIEREVTSASSVVVCWTAEALSSIYVKAEAKKGLERNVLVPIFLEPCALPVPFNAIDTEDLSRWNGDPDDPVWIRVVTLIKSKVEEAKRDAKARMAKSAAAYQRVDDKVFPGTLTLLSRRIAALDDFDRENYKADVEALLSWLLSIAEKEARSLANGYEQAERQSGGDVWYFWESGRAAERGLHIGLICGLLEKVQATLTESKTLLELPAP